MKMRKLMAMLCALTLAVSSVSVVTFADEEESPISPVEDYDDSELEWFNPNTVDGSASETTTAPAASTAVAAAPAAAAPAAAAASSAAAPAAAASSSSSAASKQAPAGAVKVEVDTANSTVSVPNGVLVVKAESNKYTADSACAKFVYAMNEDSATHTSPEIINDILGLDGTGASFQTTALMLIDAKTFELIPAGKITFTMPGNQLTQGLTSEQMKAFGAGLDTNKGFAEGVTANANGTLTVTLNEGGPFAVAKLG